MTPMILRSVISTNWKELSFGMKILDYFWHLVLPLFAMLIGGFASLTLLTKNSFLDEIGKQYVMTARAKGLAEKKILVGHVFRNAMLLIIAGFPGAFLFFPLDDSCLLGEFSSQSYRHNESHSSPRYRACCASCRSSR